MQRFPLQRKARDCGDYDWLNDTEEQMQAEDVL